jgi:hypothetical protein
MKSTIWITFRAVVALVLMAGFYVFGCAVAIVLLLVPYAEFVYVNQLLRISPRFFLGIAAVCIGAAGSILWSLVPRRDKFEAPGPQLTPESQPRLFTVLRDVADVARQQLPAEVYLGKSSRRCHGFREQASDGAGPPPPSDRLGG